MISEKIAGYICVAIYIVLFIFIMKLNKKFRFMGADTKPLKKAIEKGHVVTAYQVPGSANYHYLKKGDGTKYRSYYAHYEYMVNGKKYIKRGVTFQAMPTNEITIYYVSDPAKGFVKGERTTRNGRGLVTLLAYILPLIIAAFVYNFLTQGI